MSNRRRNNTLLFSRRNPFRQPAALREFDTPFQVADWCGCRDQDVFDLSERLDDVDEPGDGSLDGWY